MNTQLSLFDGIENTEFIEYHKTNPHLYEAFKTVAFDAIKMGFKTYGANGIFEIIRWKRAERGDGEFKINNNFAPLFARLFVNEFPQYADFFRFRRSKFTEYLKSLPMAEKRTHELVFFYENAAFILYINPTEDDWWTTLNVTDESGRSFTFDIHYCEDYNEICVYPYNGKHTVASYVKAIYTQKII
jgi:hypothetical protein